MTGAEAHHDVYAEDAEGCRLAKARVPEGVEGVARFHELVALFAEEPADVVIATIATEIGPGPVRVVAGGGRLRGSRREPAVDVALPGTALDLGGEVGSRRCGVLAELARTDAHNHRPIPASGWCWGPVFVAEIGDVHRFAGPTASPAGPG